MCCFHKSCVIQRVRSGVIQHIAILNLMILLTLFRSARDITMKHLLLATLCLVPVFSQSETICKTDANSITRCRDANGVETRWKSDANGILRSNTGEKWKQDSHGKWRNDTGTVISKDSNGVVRSNKDSNTWREDAQGKWRSSNGNVCFKDPHGAIRCKN